MLVTRAKTIKGQTTLNKQDKSDNDYQVRSLPTHKELPQVFEHVRRQAFSKDIGLLELRVNLLNVNTISSLVLIIFAITGDVLAKPMHLAVIEFSSEGYCVRVRGWRESEHHCCLPKPL